MVEPVAYHSVVHALEAAPGWTPERRFAFAVKHAIDGHLPYERLVAAGQARARQGASDAVIARRVRDFLTTDVNPLRVFLAGLHQPASVIAAYRAYCEACGAAAAPQAPPPCRSAMDALLAAALRRQSAPLQSLTAVARRLGLDGSAAADVAQVFEMEGSIRVALVAGRLGCQRRTLERQLQRMATSAEAIRQACRLVQSTLLLGHGGNLTQIAVQAGYADTAHMTRAFRAAVRMTPSMMRRLLLDDLKHGA
jgi:AraC-like DNA-binding protein